MTCPCCVRSHGDSWVMPRALKDWQTQFGPTGSLLTFIWLFMSSCGGHHDYSLERRVCVCVCLSENQEGGDNDAR